MLYYANRISDNIRKREPEGYLICVNVPIARSGNQRYLNDEVGRSDGDGNDEVTVYRPEEEVFSPATIASFEGMPVTNDHPNAEEGVNKDNIQWLQKGHAQNVHRGTGSEKDMLIADLLITDPDTIQAVLDGKREISCGYNYELSEEDGKLVQRQIRGNHIAIVDKGRAGHRVCIKDSAPKTERRKTKMAKTKHGIWAKMLAKFAVDADPEEVAEAVEAIDEIVSEKPEEEEVKATDAEMNEKLDTIKDMLENLPVKKAEEDEDEMVEEEKKTTDEEPDKQDVIIGLLKQILEKNAAPAKDCGGKDAEPEPETETDPLEKLENDLDELEAKDPEAVTADEDEVVPEDGEEFAPDEDPSEPESHFVDPEKINEEDEDEEFVAEEKTGMDRRARDSMRAAIRAVKPVIATMPPKMRKMAADAAVKSLRQSYGMTANPQKNGYTTIKQSQRKNAMDRAAEKSKAEKDLAKRIMESRNVNYKK